MTEIKKKVLIVDDEPDIVSYLSALLEDNGFEVVSAGDGVDGLKVARAEKPALVSLDIKMPEKSGVKLYRELREDETLKHIPVIIVTGGMPEQFETFISTRRQVPAPDFYILKPIKDKEYVNAVKNLTNP